MLSPCVLLRGFPAVKSLMITGRAGGGGGRNCSSKVLWEQGVTGRLINRSINELVATMMRESKPYVKIFKRFQSSDRLFFRIAMKLLRMVLPLLVLATVDRCHSSFFPTSGQLLSYARSLTQERLLTYYEELAALTTHRASINDNLKALLEKLRASMGSPNEALGIPALEPLTLTNIDVNIQEEGVDSPHRPMFHPCLSLDSSPHSPMFHPCPSLDSSHSQTNVPPLSISRQFPSQTNVPLCSSITGVVPTIAIHNLSTFVLEEINVNALALKATFGVSVPRVTCDGTYDITGVVGNLIPAWGNGPFTAEITGLNVTNGLLQIGSSNGTLFLKNLTVDFTYDNIKLHFEGLVGGGSLGDLVNQILDDLVPDLLVQFKPDILTYLSSTIKTYADNVLKTMTVSDLLKLINGGGAASLSARQ
uniref:Uncharacterized protein n=1 Tax=Timema cristinae TaxID=61476 RepID=A0A7R9DB93_TIMCR|nr:unnamed protein product [Timema cristinae]